MYLFERMLITYHSENLVAKTQHLLPDLDLLEDHLREDPETIISHAFPPGEHALRASGIEGSIVRAMRERAKFDEFHAGLERERWRIVEPARRAVSKIRAEGENATLEPDEANGLEAIVWMVGRPAILARRPIK